MSVERVKVEVANTKSMTLQPGPPSLATSYKTIEVY
jgi:hypothetical protein